jgi:hypothetical protein
MTTASIKRSRAAVKETLRAFEYAADQPSSYDVLVAEGRTVVGSYHEARELKSDFDHSMTLVHKRAIIKPLVAGGYEVRTTHDDPSEPMGRVSDVLRMAMEAEELGTDVMELLGNSSQATRSSARSRLTRANAIAARDECQMAAANWGE